MQTFYNQLNAAKGSRSTYLFFLARLTQASRADISNWHSPLAWGAWDR
ncbi:MAG: hypothetical protein ACPGWR_18565 [Ardenticatenaceae bacterium]